MRLMIEPTQLAVPAGFGSQSPLPESAIQAIVMLDVFAVACRLVPVVAPEVGGEVLLAREDVAAYWALVVSLQH